MPETHGPSSYLAAFGVGFWGAIGAAAYGAFNGTARYWIGACAAVLLLIARTRARGAGS